MKSSSRIELDLVSASANETKQRTKSAYLNLDRQRQTLYCYRLFDFPELETCSRQTDHFDSRRAWFAATVVL